MTGPPNEAVIAGSKSFALALLAPLTERVGTRPRIAADPAQALKLTAGAGLVVVEFQGDRSLEAIRQLVGQSTGLSVIAAMPDGNPAAEEALRALGVESARWDGKPDHVLTAVSRHLAGAPPAQPTRPAATTPPAPAAAPAAAVSSGVGALFDDMHLDEAREDAAALGEVSAPLHALAHAADAWPSSVPGAPEAADALGQGLRGVFAPAGAPLAVVAEVMAGMSPIEQAVLMGEPQAIDVEPIRRAAVMRVRVAVALTTAPQAGVPVDTAAVSALLAEIDGLLSEVNALLASAPAEVRPSLEQVRNALVREAIDFSEAAHAAQPGEVPAAAPAPILRKVTQARTARKAVQQDERRRERRPRALYVVFALFAAGGAAFLAWRLFGARLGS